MTDNSTRFTLELEFLSALANPFYLQHLAGRKLLDDPSFLAYLDYLSYWRRPEYVRHLLYPAPSLAALELLKDPRFRKDILAPETVSALAGRWVEDAATGVDGEVYGGRNGGVDGQGETVGGSAEGVVVKIEGG